MDKEKTTTLNLRVNPETKKKAETVLKKLGIPMSVAIDMYLNQISLTGGIPFRVTLPAVPTDINADLMTDAEMTQKLESGYADMNAGRVREASAVFDSFRKEHI